MTMTLPAAGQLAAAVPVPPAYAAAAKAKLERDRKSYLAFRAADQQIHEQIHERRGAGAVAAAEAEVALFRLDVEAVEPEAVAALEAFRASEDRAREAGEYAWQLAAEAEAVKDSGSAREVTDARVRADIADGVAAERLAAEAAAQAELEGLDRDLAEARENLEKAERALRAARAATGVPAGTAPVSDATVQSNAAFMQFDEVWGQLTDRDKKRVRAAAAPRDMMTTEELRAWVRGGLQYGAGGS